MPQIAGAIQSFGSNRRREETRSSLLCFAGEFLRDPLSVTCPVPSSPTLAPALLDGLDWSGIGCFVEYGPGTGAFTRFALERLPRTARLFAIDTSPGFTDFLRRTIPDPRLHAITGSAADVRALLAERGVEGADCILSGLPFSSLDEEDARTILRESAALLGKSGTFCAYQVRRSIEPHLERVFAQVDRRYHWLGFPPCHLYRASGARPEMLAEPGDWAQPAPAVSPPV